MKPSEKFKAGTLIKPKERFWHLDEFNPLSNKNEMDSGTILWKTDSNEIGQILDYVEDMVPIRGIDVGDIYLIVTPPCFSELPAFFKHGKEAITYIGMVVLFERRLWEIGIVPRVDSGLVKYMYKRCSFSYTNMFESPDRWFEVIYEVVNDPG